MVVELKSIFIETAMVFNSRNNNLYISFFFSGRRPKTHGEADKRSEKPLNLRR
jgi:hypothetical protein